MRLYDIVFHYDNCKSQTKFITRSKSLNHIISSFRSSLCLSESFLWNVGHIHSQIQHLLSVPSLWSSSMCMAKNRNGSNRKYGKWIEHWPEQNEWNKTEIAWNRFTPLSKIYLSETVNTVHLSSNCYWTANYQCIDMWSWTAGLADILPWENYNWMNSASYIIRNRPILSYAQLLLMKCRWKPSFRTLRKCYR